MRLFPALIACLFLTACGYDTQPDGETDADQAPTYAASPDEHDALDSDRYERWAGTYTYEEETGGAMRAYMLSLGEGDRDTLMGMLEVQGAVGEDMIAYDVRAEPTSDGVDIVLTAHRNYEGMAIPLGTTLFALEGSPAPGSRVMTQWMGLEPLTEAPAVAFERLVGDEGI
jgi:hypothetical protein